MPIALQKPAPKEQKGMGCAVRIHLLLKIFWKQFFFKSLKLVLKSTDNRNSYRKKIKKLHCILKEFTFLESQTVICRSQKRV